MYSSIHYDEIANDGIFSSNETFDFNEKVSYKEGVLRKSVLKNAIFSTEFLHLNKISETTSGAKSGNIGCNFKIVSTGCNADAIWEGFGCVELSNCSFRIEW